MLLVVCLFVFMLLFACLFFVGVVFGLSLSALCCCLSFRFNADCCVFDVCCWFCVCLYMFTFIVCFVVCLFLC